MDDTAPGTTAVDDDRAAPPRRRRWPVVLLALVTVAAVAAAAALWVDRSALQEDADRRDEIADVAGRFAAALLTYDHEDLEASRDAVTELATDDFGQEYVNAFGAGLGGQIDALEATSTATVREVFVADSEGDTSRVIVIADSEITSNAGRRGTIGTYLDMTLLHIDGRWLVDDVTSVANAGSQLDPVPGADDAAGDDGDGDGVDAGGSSSTTASTSSTPDPSTSSTPTTSTP